MLAGHILKPIKISIANEWGSRNSDTEPWPATEGIALYRKQRDRSRASGQTNSDETIAAK